MLRSGSPAGETEGRVLLRSNDTGLALTGLMEGTA